MRSPRPAAAAAASGAPTDASEKDFCDTQTSLFTDLVGDTSNPQVPSNDDMAKAVKGWADKLEKVGTPEDIPDEARAGFEATVEQAKDIDADDFSIDKLQELVAGRAGRVEGRAGGGDRLLRLPHQDLRQPAGRPQPPRDAGDARLHGVTRAAG